MPCGTPCNTLAQRGRYFGFLSFLFLRFYAKKLLTYTKIAIFAQKQPNLYLIFVYTKIVKR